MAQWPATLEQCPIIGWNEQPMSNVIEFDADVGAPRRRRRSTSAGYEISVQYKMSKADLATFWTFWEVDAKDGALQFDWPHPRFNGTLKRVYVTSTPSVSQQTNNFYTLDLTMRSF